MEVVEIKGLGIEENDEIARVERTSNSATLEEVIANVDPPRVDGR